MKGFKIWLSLALIIGCLSTTDYTKIIHDTDANAKCLDGSGPMIYLHEGGDTKNILFYFVGGGACLGIDLASTLESCYKRSKGRFGTSTLWEDTYDGVNAGILDTRPQHSRFANWTKIVIMYCDGAFHQGNNKEPVRYKDTDLYFRGAINTRSHIQWAHKRYNISQAERIIVSGGSAGGISTYLWVDYFRTLVSNPKIVYGVADSGVFYDPLINQQLSQMQNKQIIQAMLKDKQLLIPQMNLVHQKIIDNDPNPVQYLMKLSNVDEKPPNRQCSDILFEDQVWKCLFVQFSYPTLKYPILFVQSSYDAFLILYVFNFTCLKYGVSGYTLKDCGNIQMNAIQLYRAEYLQRMLPNLLKWGHSIWTISCSWHAEMINGTIYDSQLQKVPKNDGRTLRNGVQTFVFDNKRIQSIDFFGWPANTPCAY